jgi:hypothetical protein
VKPDAKSAENHLRKKAKTDKMTEILGQVLLAGFQTLSFFRLFEAFNCFISTPAHFSSKNNARATDTRS